MSLFTWNTELYDIAIRNLGKFFWRHPKRGSVKLSLLKPLELDSFVGACNSAPAIQTVLNGGIFHIESSYCEVSYVPKVDYEPYFWQWTTYNLGGHSTKKILVKERSLIFH